MRQPGTLTAERKIAYLGFFVSLEDTNWDLNFEKMQISQTLVTGSESHSVFTTHQKCKIKATDSSSGADLPQDPQVLPF